MKTIKHDAIVCPECGDIIYSIARHDWHSCSCGYCFVDGGFDYMRFGWGGPQYDHNTRPLQVAIHIDDLGEDTYYNMWANARVTAVPIGLIKRVSQNETQ